MKKIPIGTAAFLSFVVLAMGVVLYAQSASLIKLADEEMKISKMDWVLLNTRVHILEEMMKDDLSAPFSPTSYSFDRQRGKLRIAVYVDPSWSKRRLDEVSDAFSKRGTSLCVAPTLAQHGQQVAMFLTPPKDYCSILYGYIRRNFMGRRLQNRPHAAHV
jgi:hypothetical protein